ncbi:hypothetical protein Tco_0184485 [Tanacetum coccineum]
MKVEESLNVTFDETPPPPKTSPLEDDELVEEEAIECLDEANGVKKTKVLREFCTRDQSRSHEQSHDEVYGCLKGGSGNSGGKRLAISMVEEVWLSEKEEV